MYNTYAIELPLRLGARFILLEKSELSAQSEREAINIAKRAFLSI